MFFRVRGEDNKFCLPHSLDPFLAAKDAALEVTFGIVSQSQILCVMRIVMHFVVLSLFY